MARAGCINFIQVLAEFLVRNVCEQIKQPTELAQTVSAARHDADVMLSPRVPNYAQNFSVGWLEIGGRGYLGSLF